MMYHISYIIYRMIWYGMLWYGDDKKSFKRMPKSSRGAFHGGSQSEFNMVSAIGIHQ